MFGYLIGLTFAIIEGNYKRVDWDYWAELIFLFYFILGVCPVEDSCEQNIWGNTSQYLTSWDS